MKMPKASPVPVVDLFAGPGGLGEGFASFHAENETRRPFKIAISIEKEPYPHKTLTLRSFFRQFSPGTVPDEYYSYLRGEITRDRLFNRYDKQAKAAASEARMLTLGKNDPNQLIAERIQGHKHWVLIGGPPCQAYSLAGRSRILGKIKRLPGESLETFEIRRQTLFNGDERHTLYLQYLAIIAKHWPSVFVMENVRGILSSRLDGDLIFPTILKDLSDPSGRSGRGKREHRYRIFSLTTESDGEPTALQPADFLIHSERYGIPQARHRVILLGVRDDLDILKIPILRQKAQVTVQEAIGDLPKLTPGLSIQNDQRPYDALQELQTLPLDCPVGQILFDGTLKDDFRATIQKARKLENRGGAFVENRRLPDNKWYLDPNLGGVCNHETRSHIKEDIWRYAFCAWYGENYGGSPQLKEFPNGLLPNHKNVDEAIAGMKFGDRFRVQIANKPSSTITSHISKDGHYFIHYDPLQYRSLTVREAARLQTFPDNYFFEGPRTEQYKQVGNAVPPYLAKQIAEVVFEILKTTGRT